MRRPSCRIFPFFLLILLGASAVFADSLVIQATDRRRQVTIAEAAAPITLDGVLDEAVWKDAEPASAFVQAEPSEGQPASEATEVRLAWNHTTLYIGVTCFDSDPAGIIINDIRKDFASPYDQDTFEVLLDTFADRRNGFVFVTNAAGAKADTQIANEGRDVNPSWDAVWNVQARITERGWTAELAIPFNTLRFTPGDARSWGINFARRIRRRNEIDYWSPVSRVYNLYRASLAGDLVGLPGLEAGHNLRLKPFALASAVRALGHDTVDDDGEVGLDVKYGLTPALTLDVTVNPDFAQAEADEQQVNLTQFPLYFPEKREFFLENTGIFYFGDIPRESRVPARFAPPEEEMLLFFSRRIGLTESGEQVPIAGGVRVSGRAAGLGLGFLTMQTERLDERPGDNFTVARARRDLFHNGDVGAIFLSRQASGSDDGNLVGGVDANFRPRRELGINTFVARSSATGPGGDDWSGRASINWNSNFHHWQYAYLTIGDNFRDDIGFIRRVGVQKHFVDWGVRPRPERLRRLGIREVHPHIRINEYLDHDGREVTRSHHAAATLFFENGAYFEWALNPRLERIDTPFRLRPGVIFPPGRYVWNEFEAVFEGDRSRRFWPGVDFVHGGFWSGTQNRERFVLTYRPSYRILVDLGWQRNDVTLEPPLQSFVTNLVTSRIGYSFSTRMFIDALLQYNTDLEQFSANIRFDLIHRPLSDLFVVYNEQQLTSGNRPAGRGLIVKYTHMLSF